MVLGADYIILQCNSQCLHSWQPEFGCELQNYGGQEGQKGDQDGLLYSLLASRGT